MGFINLAIRLKVGMLSISHLNFHCFLGLARLFLNNSIPLEFPLHYLYISHCPSLDYLILQFFHFLLLFIRDIRLNFSMFSRRISHWFFLALAMASCMWPLLHLIQPLFPQYALWDSIFSILPVYWIFANARIFKSCRPKYWSIGYWRPYKSCINPFCPSWA